MVIESVGEQWDRALRVKISSDQIEAERATARLYALALYNASRIRLGEPEIKTITEDIENSSEFELLLRFEERLLVFKRFRRPVDPNPSQHTQPQVETEAIGAIDMGMVLV